MDYNISQQNISKLICSKKFFFNWIKNLAGAFEVNNK
jgi:hypothetical protein